MRAARVARIVRLMNNHNASSPQAENKHTISTNVDIWIINSSLSADPTSPTAHRRVSPHHPPQPKIGSAPKVKERHKTCPTQHPAQTFRTNATYRTELSDFRRIILGHAGVGIAGSRRGGRGNSGGGHGGVAFGFMMIVAQDKGDSLSGGTPEMNLNPKYRNRFEMQKLGWLQSA